MDIAARSRRRRPGPRACCCTPVLPGGLPPDRGRGLVSVGYRVLSSAWRSVSVRRRRNPVALPSTCLPSVLTLPGMRTSAWSDGPTEPNEQLGDSPEHERPSGEGTSWYRARCARRRTRPWLESSLRCSRPWFDSSVLGPGAVASPVKTKMRGTGRCPSSSPSPNVDGDPGHRHRDHDVSANGQIVYMLARPLETYRK